MTAFTPLHRGGSGPPLVLLHGSMETWRTWTLVLPALERTHEVLALTLPGHAGGPPLAAGATADTLAEAVEAAMDAAGMATAAVAGNSLGGYLALRLAERGRADSVVALAPAGGWADDDGSWRAVLTGQEALRERARNQAVHADRLARTPEGRRAALQLTVADASDVPAGLVGDLLLGVAGCHGLGALNDAAREHGWPLDPSRVDVPLRIVWGTEDRILPWPSAAARYRAWFPQADWVVLDGVGHAPQLDVPAEAAALLDLR